MNTAKARTAFKLLPPEKARPDPELTFGKTCTALQAFLDALKAKHDEYTSPDDRAAIASWSQQYERYARACIIEIGYYQPPAKVYTEADYVEDFCLRCLVFDMTEKIEINAAYREYAIYMNKKSLSPIGPRKLTAHLTVLGYPSMPSNGHTYYIGLRLPLPSDVPAAVTTASPAAFPNEERALMCIARIGHALLSIDKNCNWTGDAAPTAAIAANKWIKAHYARSKTEMTETSVMYDLFRSSTGNPDGLSLSQFEWRLTAVYESFPASLDRTLAPSLDEAAVLRAATAKPATNSLRSAASREPQGVPRETMPAALAAAQKQPVRKSGSGSGLRPVIMLLIVAGVAAVVFAITRKSAPPASTESATSANVQAAEPASTPAPSPSPDLSAAEIASAAPSAQPSASTSALAAESTRGDERGRGPASGNRIGFGASRLAGVLSSEVRAIGPRDGPLEAHDPAQGRRPLGRGVCRPGQDASAGRPERGTVRVTLGPSHVRDPHQPESLRCAVPDRPRQTPRHPGPCHRAVRDHARPRPDDLSAEARSGHLSRPRRAQ